MNNRQIYHNNIKPSNIFIKKLNRHIVRTSIPDDPYVTRKLIQSLTQNNDNLHDEQEY